MDEWRCTGSVVSVNPARREARVRYHAPFQAPSETTEWLWFRIRNRAKPLRCKVESIRVQEQGLIATFCPGVTRDTVASLRHAEVVTRESDTPEYDMLDVDGWIGLTLVGQEEGETLGRVVDGFVTAAHGVAEVETPDGDRFLLPVTAPVVVDINREKGIIIVRDLTPYMVRDAD